MKWGRAVVGAQRQGYQETDYKKPWLPHEGEAPATFLCYEREQMNRVGKVSLAPVASGMAQMKCTAGRALVYIHVAKEQSRSRFHGAGGWGGFTLPLPRGGSVISSVHFTLKFLKSSSL